MSKFVQQVFVEHQLLWAEPFAECCGEPKNAKRNSVYFQAADKPHRETIQCHFIIIQRRKQVSNYGAAGRSSGEGAQRGKLWVRKNDSGREEGFELGLIISALIFGEGKKKKKKTQT